MEVLFENDPDWEQIQMFSLLCSNLALTWASHLKITNYLQK